MQSERGTRPPTNCNFPRLLQLVGGQAMIEYLLVAAAVIAALVLVVPSLGTAVRGVLTNAVGQVK